MTPLEQLVDRSSCQQLMTAYCTMLDKRDAEGFVALFTDDVVFKIGDTERHGKDPIRASILARPASLLSWHLMLNHEIEFHDDNRAEGNAVGLVVRGTRDRETWPMPIRGVELVMHYRMLFRREGGSWLIERCETSRRLDIDAAPIAATEPA
ncbi:MAG: nuclear transport factor 2 family protein [Mesorhizobium sp.]